MANAVQVPHLAFPVTLGADGSLAVVEQDSADEIVQCVAVLLSTAREEREEVPTYGIIDPTFSVGLDEAEILDALETWEPRAATAITDSISTTDELMLMVRVGVATAVGDF